MGPTIWKYYVMYVYVYENVRSNKYVRVGDLQFSIRFWFCCVWIGKSYIYWNGDDWWIICENLLAAFAFRDISVMALWAWEEMGNYHLSTFAQLEWQIFVKSTLLFHSDGIDMYVIFEIMIFDLDCRGISMIYQVGR